MTGSVFVQISDENLHHVRELMDEVFGCQNFCRIISIAKTSGLGAGLLPVSQDYILWYARDIQRIKFKQIYLDKFGDSGELGMYKYTDENGRPYRLSDLTGQNNNVATCLFEYEYKGRKYRPASTRQWKTNFQGFERLKAEDRLVASGNGLYYKRYLDDFMVKPITDSWGDTGSGGFTEQKIYAVQTNVKVIQRCILMTTDPGELVLDPTCGSGTSAYTSEMWGRRWITIDVSRVPLALTRQRLLTATFQYHKLQDQEHGPAGGFVYARRQNRKGEEVGGIVPHITLESITKAETAKEEILVDRPEPLENVTRVSGPFTVEAVIPTSLDSNLPEDEDTGAEASGFSERLLEALRKSPVLHMVGNRTVAFKNVRPQAKTLSLSAEAVDEDGNAVAFVFGPENGAVSERLVFEAAREAYAKSYSHLYVIGLQIEANALLLVNSAAESVGVPTTYVPVTSDITMGDLLKNMRSSQIFSVCGLPDVALRPAIDGKYEVELRGLDTFDPVTMDNDHMDGDDVPAWLLDTDYNGLCFHVTQAFFPRTSAWDNLKKTLKADYEPGVWDRLAGNLSVPFEMGEHRQVAVKVIDDRGNELIVIKSEAEAEK